MKKTSEPRISYPPPWVKSYGTVAVLLLLLMVLNPELRVFLLVTQFIGADLMIFFVALQLWYLLPSILPILNRARSFFCIASFMGLRAGIRLTAALLGPSRLTYGVTLLLFVVSRNLWCPTGSQGGS